MQEEEEDQQQQQESCGDTESQPVRVHVSEIRRQWAVHEDEAFAYRLQNEEITQHYCGNRTRNAIVRDDFPKAREEQKREEQQALEQRFQQLHLLAQQAEEDALLAKELADRYQMGLEAGSLLEHGGGAGGVSTTNEAAIAVERKPSADCALATGVLSHSPPLDNKFNNAFDNQPGGPGRGGGGVARQGTDPGHFSSGGSTSSNNSTSGEKKVKSIMKPSSSSSSSSSRKEMFTPLLGAAAKPKISSSSTLLEAASSSSSSSSSYPTSTAQAAGIDPDFQNLDIDLPPLDLVQGEEAKLLQEKLDEEVALKLQKEFEQMEIDKRLAVEAQDRELAKMIHQKEKERLRRAKERAKMKAAAAALEFSQSTPNAGGISPAGPSQSPSFSDHGSSVEIGDRDRFSNPPRIPEKNSHPRLDRDDPVRFRAEPKALPPQPLHLSESQSPSRRISSSRLSNSNSSHHSHDSSQLDPIPPYMPLQGLQFPQQKKRNK